MLTINAIFAHHKKVLMENNHEGHIEESDHRTLQYLQNSGIATVAMFAAFVAAYAAFVADCRGEHKPTNNEQPTTTIPTSKQLPSNTTPQQPRTKTRASDVRAQK